MFFEGFVQTLANSASILDLQRPLRGLLQAFQSFSNAFGRPAEYLKAFCMFHSDLLRDFEMYRKRILKVCSDPFKLPFQAKTFNALLRASCRSFKWCYKGFLKAC